ncbi:sel1 repeat family protein [Peteryoungia desertarenae]|uniref:Sel1 repeat family protein n=1 Tax=Peteryoungia desertarenae TaxID=1813451 RepID=A0ABX6QHN6_9HYPH|nr:tetratricopeptide repeat protein [Peteryoungia desertarenae]QLF68084.1 sel1 repeat family protein [Peteryoungia desertarenae]
MNKVLAASRFFFAGLATIVCLLGPPVLAQEEPDIGATPAIRPVEPSDALGIERGERPAASGDDADVLDRSDRGDRVQPTQKGDKPGAAETDEEPKGINIYLRMGAPLPELPPKKEYTGPIDEAYGAFQRGLFLTAVDKALPRAQLGDPAAQTLLAEIMSRGLGVKQDLKGASFWYRQAAEGGDPAAMFKYALLLMEGRHVERDKAKADEFMRRAAEAGNASAQFNWAQILVADNPGERGLNLAMPFYEKSAEQGIADAQYALAQIYSSLDSVPAEKKAQARDWMLRAARAGFDTAQLDLGIWYVNGRHGEQDHNEGYRWLSIAANRGNVVAQNRLAHLYINALGTNPDPVEAAKWYVLSRRAGLKDLVLEDFYLGINEDQQKKAIEAANRFRRG